jgi:hypothetical protein
MLLAPCRSFRAVAPASVGASARQRQGQPRAAGSDACDRGRVDGVRPAILRQVEPWIASDQGDVAPAGAVDVAGLAARHGRLRREVVRPLPGLFERGSGQRAQVVVRRHHRQVAASGAEIGAEMQPNRAPLQAGTARQAIIQSEMTEFVAAVGCEHHVAGGRRGNEAA